MTIYDVLKIFRNDAFRTERGKGEKFEKLMQRWLLTDPTYSNIFTKVWMWKDSPCVDSMGKTDLGIDLVALDDKGGYWAIQCKCLDGEKSIPKEKVDSFLSNSDSSREFVVDSKKCKFSNRMWISTTYKFGKNAEKAFDNLNPQVVKVNLNTLNESQVDWELLLKGKNGAEALRKKATPLEHQQPIIEAALNHFKENERGTLVMACGTGKTLTSMFITQQMLNNKGLVLFLAPSIALVGQSLNSWFANSEKPIKAVCICSDNSAGDLSYNDEDDIMQESLADLPIRSCTNPNAVVEEIERYKNHDGLLVCFSTYQSIDVVERAQKMLFKKHNNKFGNFDFIICDEAHRTASVKVSGKDITDFVKIHDGSFIKGTHRMYMTATPKVYQEGSKSKATLNDDVLFSMDDEKVFGKHFYTLGFGSAVQKGLLTDYKVLVLTIDEGQANSEFLEAYKQYVETEKKKGKFIEQITPQQQAMILGSVSAMSKQLLYANQDDFAEDEDMRKPMHTAIAFCDNVRRTSRTKRGVYVAEEITEAFESVTRIYKEVLGNDADSQDFIEDLVDVKSEMVSGDMPTNERNENLRILREHFDDEEKRSNIVCNVNCLSEGVDVPALDAAIFLASKKSVITIVQSVGRVMRKFVGKKYGYIIIPVVIPIGADANAEMDKNERYKLIWNILNAMRSHDERLAAELSNHNYTHVKVVSPASPRSYTRYGNGSGSGTSRHGKSGKKTSPDGGTEELTLNIPLEFVDKLYARMVDKVGERMYWEKWSGKVGSVAHSFMGRLKELIAKGKYVAEIDKFVKDLQININPSINREQAIQFLAQQLVTQPVFDALFPDYKFTKNNTVSRSIQNILDKMQDEAFVKDREVLHNFYDEVSQVCGTLRTIEEKQDTIKTLYEKFFAKGISNELHMVEQFGIVYTPIECVDFIIKSVDDVLKREFHTSLKDRGVNILDPFTGTGTFITQTLNYLYKHGISSEDLEYKYKNEIHCNEIVLLSYYIADVNIESVFNDIVKRKDYIPYNNICLTDTFQLAESKQGALKIDGYFKENTAQINRQKKLPIRVIIGNPPYSVGQKKANDNAQNMDYPALNERISETYAKESSATLKNSLYDSYFKAFRWASDRIHQNKNQGGIVAFISPNSWLDGTSTNGFRNCLEYEFTDIYVYNLRGNQTSTLGELSRKEGGKIFGSGSRLPIAITILVYNPDKPESLRRRKPFEKNEGNQRLLPMEYYVADIHYLDIGDYLSRDDKLKKIKETSSVLSKKFGDTIIVPNDKGDWINQRGGIFDEMIIIGNKDKKTNEKSWFEPIYSCGVKTNRDCWCYNSSNFALSSNIRNSIDFYNREVDRFNEAKSKNDKLKVNDFVNFDPQKFSWDRDQRDKDIPRGKKYVFSEDSIREAIYRPFFKQYIYFNRQLNNCVYQQPKLFPTSHHKNLVICVSGIGVTKDFSCIITDMLPDLELIGKSQCFPLYWYESKDEYNKRMHKQDSSGMADMFAGEMAYENADFDTYGYVRHDGVTDYIIKEIKKRYGLSAKSNDITKEDVFYYVYGILHSKEYRETFTFDLRKSLPRIPIVETAAEFKAFMEAGRKLAALHLNYEQVEPCSQVTITIKSELGTKEYTVGENVAADSSVSYGDQSKLFRVEKMRFPSKNDKSTILYNNRITISNIPLEAYEYIVNGKSAVAWIMERYCISQDKDSLIVNDGNKWSEEHNYPRYIFDLLLSVINVSVQTVKIVNELPKVKFE